MSAAHNPVARLIEITMRLCEMLSKENSLLAARRPRELAAHQEDRTVWQVFEDERPSLVGYRGPFDGFHAVPASVSKTCLVRFDSNKYSVAARAVGRPVESMPRRR